VLLANARDIVCDDVPHRRSVAGFLLLAAVAGEPALFVVGAVTSWNAVDP
jgi:hypothetical protein